jgi:DNA-binding helix-turn-helix protein
MFIDREKLNIAMARALLTGTGLSQKAGISTATLVRAGKGKSIKQPTVGKIAQALGVDVTDIMKED